MKTPVLETLALQFAILSLLAFGGVNAVVPEIHRQAVDVRHWMDGREFAALFAIAQAVPGPNFLIATLVGQKVAGPAGALIATAALCAPSCVLTYWVAKAWDRYRAAPLRIALGAGLAPVAVGLVFSSAWLLSRAADADWRLAAITLASAAAAGATRLHPLWLLGAAALLGAVGVLG
ncbi:MAG TPA: chromate transporter [Caulobacteraceae bacterium]|nr:chromate transporter [Caulobacteraceae bacterium]